MLSTKSYNTPSPSFPSILKLLGTLKSINVSLFFSIHCFSTNVSPVLESLAVSSKYIPIATIATKEKIRSNLVIPNFFFGSGIAFTFIPVSAMTFATISSRKVADGAGLHSLYKCALTAVVTTACSTFIQRVSQVHQTYLVHNIAPESLSYKYHLAILKSHYLINLSHYMAGKKAISMVYKQMLLQARLSAFYDLFLILTMIAICSIPLVFLLKPIVKEAEE